MNKPIQCRSDMRLQCMGHVRLIDAAGHDLTPRTRKARALLAYLALAGRPISRERLADLLWSDRGADQARSSLRQALHELRHIGSPGAALVTASRSEVEVNRGRIETELDAIRSAAAARNAGLLLPLLKQLDQHLLADLDGLDPIFDEWLRSERVGEPEGTLCAAIEGTRQILAVDGPAAAAPIIAEIQRVDPACEEAVRLRMEIDHRLGDRAGLHRHFAQFGERLHKDFGAQPSPKTVELFARLAGPEAPDPPASSSADPRTSEQDRFPLSVQPKRLPSLAALGMLVVIVGVASLAWQRIAPPAVSTDLPLVVVLPFEQQSATPAPLAAGLWDDTRLALSQNRSMRVLGRTTSLSLAVDNPSPQSLHRRLGVDYLLEGGVRSQGDRARIVVSLTRAKDGISVWEKSFEGRLGDPLALQLAVAQGIEGRLRARLAPGGGAHASQIATSPEVYALYSEARSLIRQRGSTNIEVAAVKLREAVRLDPNYAPAWASLSTTARIARDAPPDENSDRVDAVANARRAIDLAPNLAEAHAALALAEGEGLISSQRHLERALAIDPDNAEAWNWLGNSFAKQRRRGQAIDAWERSLAVDPYFVSPLINVLAMRFDSGEAEAATALLKRLAAKRQDSNFLVFARAQLALFRGDYSAAVALARSGAPSDSMGRHRRMLLGHTLMCLGYPEAAGRLWKRPPLYAALIRGERLPPDDIEGRNIGPREFWMTVDFPNIASRVMLNRGRPDLVVAKYRRGFRDRADFLAAATSADTLDSAGQLLAVALRRVGDEKEASAILAVIERQLRRQLADAPRSSTTKWELARTRAQQGDRAEALALLGAVDRAQWLPDGERQPIDIARDPALRPLVGAPHFEALRRRILSHVQRERRELGPITI